MSDTQSASTFTDRVLQGLIQSDEPLENGYTSEELEEFQQARIRSPEEAADAITAMMIRAGSARLPSARGRSAPPKHTLISRRGHDLRMEHY